MLKYQLVFVVFFYLFIAVPVRCQTADSIENLPDTGSHFVAPLTQNINIPETLRIVPPEQIKKYLNDPEYAYANDSAYWRNDPPPARVGPFFKFLSGKTFQWIFFLVIVAVVLFGLYRIALENNLSGFFGRWAKSVKINGEETGQRGVDDLDMLIAKYQSEGDYRMAVRYLYLRLIKTAIANRNIYVRRSSTNALIEKGFNNQKELADFRYLARAFEYVFYGGFSPAYPAYETLRNRFDLFQETLLN